MKPKERLHLKGYIQKAGDDNDGTLRAAIASSEVVDRMGEVVDVGGMSLKNFKRNPILLWAHNASFTEDRPPIGRVVKTWIDGIKKKKLMFSVKFDMNDPFARLIYKKYVDGFLNAFSIGFQVLERDDNVFTKSELLEISAVPVPANPEALVALRSVNVEPVDWKVFFGDKKALTNDTVTAKPEPEPEPEPEDEEVEPEAEIKKAVPYKEYPLAPVGTNWEANEAKKRMAEMAGGPSKKNINWVKYRKGFAWYDNDNVEKFGAYKLPHHDVINGQVKTVWRGVASAMALLLGSRGNIDMPEKEKKAVYNHLKKHYIEFDKEVPKFRSLADTKETMDAVFTNKKEINEKLVETLAEKAVQKYIAKKKKTKLSDGKIPAELRDSLKMLVTIGAIALSRIKDSEKGEGGE